MCAIQRENSSYTKKIDWKTKKPVWQAIVQCKCPNCTEGDLFKTKATDLRRFNELNAVCKVCGFNFMPEPGFYQLSLYFTYVVSIAFFVVFGVATYYLFHNPALWVYYVAVITPTILTAPWNVRYSKVVMLYAFGNVRRSK